MYLFIAILDVIAAVFNGLNVIIEATKKKFDKDKAAIGFYGTICVLDLVLAVAFFNMFMNK